MLPVKIIGDEFNIFFKKSSSLKITVVASKKIARKAVDRNRIRRIIEEALRSLNAKGNFKFIVKNNIANQKMQQVREKLTKLFANSKFEKEVLLCRIKN